MQLHQFYKYLTSFWFQEVTDVRGADEASLREQIITWKDASEIQPEGGELVLDQWNNWLLTKINY